MRSIVAAAIMAATAGLAACATTSGYVDPSAPPTFGALRLAAGFDDDPRLIELTAGGDLDASGLGAGCVGGIAAAPDFRVTYSAGGYPLTFAAISSQDTTLVINAPDGRWYCDDDGGGEGDPLYTFARPQTGVYDIWVGVYGGGTAPATLYISEQ